MRLSKLILLWLAAELFSLKSASANVYNYLSLDQIIVYSKYSDAVFTAAAAQEARVNSDVKYQRQDYPLTPVETGLNVLSDVTVQFYNGDAFASAYAGTLIKVNQSYVEYPEKSGQYSYKIVGITNAFGSGAAELLGGGMSRIESGSGSIAVANIIYKSNYNNTLSVALWAKGNGLAGDSWWPPRTITVSYGPTDLDLYIYPKRPDIILFSTYNASLDESGVLTANGANVNIKLDIGCDNPWLENAPDSFGRLNATTDENGVWNSYEATGKYSIFSESLQKLIGTTDSLSLPIGSTFDLSLLSTGDTDFSVDYIMQNTGYAFAVPEPASIALLGIGIVGLFGYRKSNKVDSVADNT